MLHDRGAGGGSRDPAVAHMLSPSSVKSATRTLDIIEYVVAHTRPCVAQDIATALNIPASSLSYLLSTLVERGYLDRDGRRYLPGPSVERLQMRRPTFTLAERVAPIVRTVRVQLNETTSFFERDGWSARALVTETSEHALRYAVEPGARTPLHCLSAGKALLAALPDAERDAYFAAGGRHAYTPRTVTGEAALRAELEAAGAAGIARTHEEYTLGIHGLGRVMRMNGEAVGAIAVAIPSVRYDAATDRRAAALLDQVGGLLDTP